MMYSEFLAMSGKEECYISYREYTVLMEINSVSAVLTTRKEQWKYDILLIRI